VEVLSSRILLQPSDFAAARRFYEDALGLRIYREYGIDGRVTGVVLFLGGGFLELTATAGPPSPVTLWLQVPDLGAEHERLAERDDVTITAPPRRMPWGLDEMWLAAPDGVQIVLVEVPEGHPIRSRVHG